MSAFITVLSPLVIYTTYVCTNGKNQSLCRCFCVKATQKTVLKHFGHTLLLPRVDSFAAYAYSKKCDNLFVFVALGYADGVGDK